MLTIWDIGLKELERMCGPHNIVNCLHLEAPADGPSPHLDGAEASPGRLTSVCESMTLWGCQQDRK